MKNIDEYKNYYSIGEVSKILGIHEQTIRMYERKNLFIPIRNEKRVRLFSKSDIIRLDLIVTLTQELKMTHAGVKLVLALSKRMNLADDELLDFVTKNKKNFYSG